MVAVRRNHRRRVIARMAQRLGWTRGAELGVFRGDTFLYLLDALPALEMVGVDIWRPQPEKDGIAPGGRSYLSHDLESYFAHVTHGAQRFGPRATLMRMSTVEAASRFPDGHFDFVFIDADHTAAGVSADIMAWAPKVNADGWIMGHDFNPRKFPGVVQCVREMVPRYRVLEDTVWAVAKTDTVFA